MRYLGFHINNRLTNTTHINNRKRSTLLAIIKLEEQSSFSDSDLAISAKIQMYKSYIRPILFSGLDGMSLNKTEKKNTERLNVKLLKLLSNSLREQKTH